MPGRIVHFELVASDADRASGFWNGLFGWNIGGSTMEGFDYRMFDLGTGQGGAIFPAQEGQSPGAATHGWFSGCNDTEGNAFSLWQGDENAA